MSIHSISFHNFRNLLHTSLSFDNHLNFITGLNASGKTSLLESIYYLSTGRSFRTRKFENVISKSNDANEFIIFGETFDSSQNKVKHSIGIKKSKVSKTQIKLDGQNINSASTLAYLSPVIVIDPISFGLLSGPPKSRRKFLDWGVFHVEHPFTKVWNNYIYCLKQRNSILRTGKIDRIQLAVWDKQIVELGEQIHLFRAAYTESYIEHVYDVLKQLHLNENIKINYYKGWEKSSSLAQVFEQFIIKDIDRKFTQYGPHRADLKITVNGKSVEETLSRGQQKLLVVALHIAHIQSLLASANKRTVVLIDDITAELDKYNLAHVFSLLQKLDTQIICTLLNVDELNTTIKCNETYNMFHVEHGDIKAIE